MNEDDFENVKDRPTEFSKFEDENTGALIAAIKGDIEDDLYNRDGDTNEVGTAMQRLQAIAGAGKLTASFSQVASGLGQMADMAIEKKERLENERARAAQQGQLTPEEIEKKEQEESEEFSQKIQDVTKQQQKLEREREEWSRSMHSYAGIEMTGAEWGEFADKLKGDTPLRKWLLEKLKKEGKPEGKANEMADQMALLAKMQNLPPNQWTTEMKALDTKLKSDPKLKHELQEELREAKTYDSDFQAGGQKIALNAETSAAATNVSTANRDEALSQSLGAKVSLPPAKPDQFSVGSGDPQFPTAPDLGEHHRAAMEAKEPLDAPKQIAAFVPTPTSAPLAPGAGFDV